MFFFEGVLQLQTMLLVAATVLSKAQSISVQIGLAVFALQLFLLLAHFCRPFRFPQTRRAYIIVCFALLFVASSTSYYTQYVSDPGWSNAMAVLALLIVLATTCILVAVGLFSKWPALVENLIDTVSEALQAGYHKIFPQTKRPDHERYTDNNTIDENTPTA
jgi:hypothetical protein